MAGRGQSVNFISNVNGIGVGYEIGVAYGQATPTVCLVNLRSRELCAEVGEQCAEVCAKGGCTGNDADGDEGSNQAVFDGCCAGLILEKTCEKSCHVLYPC